MPRAGVTASSPFKSSLFSGGFDAINDEIDL